MHPITVGLPATLCYLDGEHSALRDARISVLDSGFILGDSMQGYVPVPLGQPFCLEEHMAPPKKQQPFFRPDGRAIGNGRRGPI